jgi:hypothetical protein
MNHNIFNDRLPSDIEEQAHPDSVAHEVPRQELSASPAI